MRGVVVSLELDRLHFPRECAACGGIATTRKLLTGLFASTDGLSVPCCAECWLRGSRWSPGPINLALTCLVAAPIAGAIGAFIELPVSVLLALAAGAAGACTAVVFYAITRAAARQGSAWPPVRIVRRRSSQLVLFCSSEKWGAELAEKSGGTTLQSLPRINRSFLLSVAASTALGLLMALIGWDHTHTRLRVDNAGATPLMIWIDGARYQVFPSNPNGAPPPQLRIRSGFHDLGYSEPSAGAPLASIRVDVPHTQSLYNPGQTACYWLIQTVYAESWSPLRAAPDRALERSEFHQLPFVDDWFKESPAKVEVRSSSVGEKRTALLRNGACTALVAHGCSEIVLAKLTACQIQATTREAFETCVEDAAAACGLKRKEDR